jgi:hypothetical protein
MENIIITITPVGSTGSPDPLDQKGFMRIERGKTSWGCELTSELTNEGYEALFDKMLRGLQWVGRGR